MAQTPTPKKWRFFHPDGSRSYDAEESINISLLVAISAVKWHRPPATPRSRCQYAVVEGRVYSYEVLSRVHTRYGRSALGVVLTHP